MFVSMFMVVFILTFYTSSSNGHDRLFRCIEKSGVFAYLNLYTQTLVLYDQRCYVAKLPIVCSVTYRVSWSRVWSSPSHRKLTLHLKIRSRTLESVSQLYYYCVAFFCGIAMTHYQGRNMFIPCTTVRLKESHDLNNTVHYTLTWQIFIVYGHFQTC